MLIEARPIWANFSAFIVKDRLNKDRNDVTYVRTRGFGRLEIDETSHQSAEKCIEFWIARTATPCDLA